MAITVKLKYLRIAPRKVRLVADSLRGKTAEEAAGILQFLVKKASKPLLKLLNSGIASANTSQLQGLYISKIMVDEGPKLKRWRARSRGRAFSIEKKTSHITLVLEGGEKKTGKKVASKKPPLKEKKVLEKKPEVKKEIKPSKPIEKGIKRIFRRKSF